MGPGRHFKKMDNFKRHGFIAMGGWKGSFTSWDIPICLAGWCRKQIVHSSIADKGKYD